MIKRTCLLLLASSLLASPAMARDRTLYLGIEGGLLWAKDVNLDLNTPTARIDNFISIDHKMGYDIDALFGYDAGYARAELELGYKRASHDEYSSRGQGTTIFDGDGSTRYISIMTNLLLDFGNEDGLSFYAGPGAGFAWGKFQINHGSGSDLFRYGGTAWQLIAGVRYAVSPNMDVGAKYRYFHPSRIKESAGVDSSLRGRFTSHSILASLIYNFYTPPPPPPAPPPPLPPAPPPAMQTCYDGSMILATDVCPPPPPPP
ncbi:MAG: outer membrane protein, partial [Sphingomicrobium sp.]